MSDKSESSAERQAASDSTDSRVASARGKPRRRCNDLDGRKWLQNSISIWSDIRKDAEEKKLKHPALFPRMLAQRLLESFLPPEAELVLDPFCGSGSTLLAAAAHGVPSLGLELSPEYVRLFEQRRRRQQQDLFAEVEQAAVECVVRQADAMQLEQYIEPGTVDLCLTSPPYWNVLQERRSADLKQSRDYGNLHGDLGTVADYGTFIEQLGEVFGQVLIGLKPGGYCCIVVMDLRKKSQFFPFHSDLAGHLQQRGFVWDDLIVWNRQSEYNNLRPLGYPSVFRINKVHEFVLVMQKPRG